ncbi:unnamed protein product [Symbiodinium necroappetens]|uniref:Uncharacterized protein n=1 Tax=Symbiodinium necroappetens TaxID=1628268 RepID=A0A812J202_9DINO|nr:unnamed protein product [Symbiodinium necroappetens]
MCYMYDLRNTVHYMLGPLLMNERIYSAVFSGSQPSSFTPRISAMTDKGKGKGKNKSLPDTISVYVKWCPETKELFDNYRIRWNEEELVIMQFPDVPVTIEDMGSWIESRVERIYELSTQGMDKIMVQSQYLTTAYRPDKYLPWQEPAHRYFRDGDVVMVQCQAMSAQQRDPFTKEEIETFKKSLRFEQGDRVLCNCGQLWISGWIVGTAVEDDQDLLPYVVKTDPIPGLPSRTISVPHDRDEVCVQEVCFNPSSELHFVKCAATRLAGSAKPQLRFTEGDKVTVRLKNGTDGLERWVSGCVTDLWPALPGKLQWEIEGVTGEYPKEVPYRVDLSPLGWCFVHRDDHTLIRREGLQPQTRVKGMSKRLEVIRCEDGSREQVDHQTERRKRMPQSSLDDISDSDDDV